MTWKTFRFPAASGIPSESHVSVYDHATYTELGELFASPVRRFFHEERTSTITKLFPVYATTRAGDTRLFVIAEFSNGDNFPVCVYLLKSIVPRSRFLFPGLHLRILLPGN